MNNLQPTTAVICSKQWTEVGWGGRKEGDALSSLGYWVVTLYWRQCSVHHSIPRTVIPRLQRRLSEMLCKNPWTLADDENTKSYIVLLFFVQFIIMRELLKKNTLVYWMAIPVLSVWSTSIKVCDHVSEFIYFFKTTTIVTAFRLISNNPTQGIQQLSHK